MSTIHAFFADKATYVPLANAPPAIVPPPGNPNPLSECGWTGFVCVAWKRPTRWVSSRGSYGHILWWAPRICGETSLRWGTTFRLYWQLGIVSQDTNKWNLHGIEPNNFVMHGTEIDLWNPGAGSPHRGKVPTSKIAIPKLNTARDLGAQMKLKYFPTLTAVLEVLQQRLLSHVVLHHQSFATSVLAQELQVAQVLQRSSFPFCTWMSQEVSKSTLLINGTYWG